MSNSFVTSWTVAHQTPMSWDFPVKNIGIGCPFLLQCMKVKSEVVQSCPTLSDPMDCSPPGSSVHGIFQARVLEWGAIFFYNYNMKMSMNKINFLSCVEERMVVVVKVAQSCLTATPWSIQSMEFSRPEHWSG